MTRLRFGRLPTHAPDITGTIMAMVAQYESARDRNILSAWNKGGEFEGKKVTDGDLLDHFDQRIEDSAPGDPIRDYWQETKWQYQFAIAESKVGLSYKQGHIKEGAVAAFYKHWATKVPKDSEAWRSMMNKAAGFEQATRAARGVSTRTLQINAYNRQMADIQKSTIDPGMKAWTYLVNAAAGLHIPIDVNSGGMGMDNTANIDDLLATTAAQNPDDYDQLMAAMSIAFPGRHRGQPLTSNDILKAMSTMRDGLRQQIKATKKMGYSTSALETQLGRVKANVVNLRVAKADIADDYRDAETEYRKDLDAAAGDPSAVVKANEAFAKAIHPLIGAANKAGAIGLSGSLLDHYRAARGEKPRGNVSPGKDWSAPPATHGEETIAPEDAVAAAKKGVDTTGTLTDLEATAANALQSKQELEGYAKGELARVYDADTKTYAFVAVTSLPPGTQTRLVRVPDTVITDPETGKTTMVKGGFGTQAATPAPVKALIGQRNAAGEVINPDDPTTNLSTNSLYYQMTWGDGDVTKMTTIPNGKGGFYESFTDDELLQPGSGGKVPELLPDGQGGFKVFYTPDEVHAINSSLVIDSQFNAGALLLGKYASVDDLLTGTAGGQTGVAAQNAIVTYEKDERGNLVPKTNYQGTVKAGGTQTATGEQDPYAFMGQQDGILGVPRDGADNATYYRRIYDTVRGDPSLSGMLTDPGLIGAEPGYKGDGKTEEQRFHEVLGRQGVTVPEGFTPPAPKPEGAPTTAEGVATSTGLNTADYQGPLGGSMGHGIVLDYAAIHGVKRSDLTLVHNWASNTLEQHAKSLKGAQSLVNEDLVTIYKEDLKRNPKLGSDADLQRQWFEGADLIRASAGWSGSEGQYQGAVIMNNPLMQGNGYFAGALRSLGQDVADSAFAKTLPAQQQAALAGLMGPEAQKVAQFQLHPLERMMGGPTSPGGAGREALGQDLFQAAMNTPEGQAMTPDQRTEWWWLNVGQKKSVEEARNRIDQVDPESGALLVPTPTPGATPPPVGGAAPTPPGMAPTTTPGSPTGGAGFNPPSVVGGVKPTVKPVPKPTPEPGPPPPPNVKVPKVTGPTVTSPTGGASWGSGPTGGWGGGPTSVTSTYKPPAKGYWGTPAPTASPAGAGRRSTGKF